MSEITNIIKNLIDIQGIEEKSSQDIIEEICSNLYEKKNYNIKDKEVYSKLPAIIKDIILLIDFDTELSMNGILGFLENSTGLYLDDTIDTLKKINASEDYKALKSVKSILDKYGINIQLLRNNVNSGYLYDITSFSKTHGSKYDKMADEIVEESNKLYLYQNDRNIFDLLEQYVELNKANLIE